MRSGSRTAVLAALVLFSATCGSDEATGNREQEDAFQAERILMVRSQIERRGIRDEAVLRAMQTVPREEFVPASERRRAYSDRPLPIGEGQTISQPYIVALMSSLARITPGQRVLEIGTGSGYQAAVLAELEAEVYSIELLPGIAARAEATLGSLGYGDIHLRVGDGYLGWPEAAPFDRIVVTAAPPGDSPGASRPARARGTPGGAGGAGSVESAPGGRDAGRGRGNRCPGPRRSSVRPDGPGKALNGWEGLQAPYSQ